MTDYAKCVYCGGDITEDHDAEKLASGDLAHPGCASDPTGAKTDQGRLNTYQ